MKLKRYVLLDNNAAYKNQIFIDVSIPLRGAKHVVKEGNLYIGFLCDETNEIYGLRRCGKIIVTSDEATDLIYKGDMAKYYNRRGFVETSQVYKVEEQWVKFKDETVHKDKILAIYKLIGKDYICVWEKEKM